MQVCQDLREVSRRTRFPQPLFWMYKLPMTRRASLTTNTKSLPEQVRQDFLVCWPGLNTLTCIVELVSVSVSKKHQLVQDNPDICMLCSQRVAFCKPYCTAASACLLNIFCFSNWSDVFVTADGNEGGRHHLITAAVGNGNLYIMKVQIGDKRWFKGARKDAEGAWNSFTVA